MLTVFLLVVALSQSAVNGPSSSQAQATPTTGAPSPSEVSELQREAEKGNPEAQFKLGRAYEQGKVLPQDDTLAAKWYRKAAEQGNREAQTNLGFLYREGRGVGKNKQESVKWYRKAARQGDPRAMFNLGVAYYNGDGVEINDVSAYAWFLLAEAAGDTAGGAAARRSETQMRPGGIGDGLLRVAQMYEDGVDLNPDPAQAVLWYRKAAEKGVPEAEVKLAILLSRGEGVAQNYEEARSWCEALDKKGFVAGTYCLGQMYRNGLGVPKDLGAAKKMYEKAAEHGDATAMLQLGEMYWKGEGTKPDKVVAYSWMLAASYCRDPNAVEDAVLLQKQMSEKEMGKARQRFSEFFKTHGCAVPLTPGVRNRP